MLHNQRGGIQMLSTPYSCLFLIYMTKFTNPPPGTAMTLFAFRMS